MVHGSHRQTLRARNPLAIISGNTMGMESLLMVLVLLDILVYSCYGLPHFISYRNKSCPSKGYIIGKYCFLYFKSSY
jgi:hypothetical protein